MHRANRTWLAAVGVALAFAGAFTARAVSEPRNNFHFSILGDRTGSAQPGIYQRVWREIDLLHPDFVINVGDTIEGGDDVKAPAEWAMLRPLWDRYRQYPLYFTPGNHDIWSPASRRLYEKETGRPPHYSFNYQDAHFTVLDNSRTDGLAGSEMRFLDDDLAANQDKHPKFVFFHKPLWLIPLKFQSGAFPLHKLAVKYGVDCVISGHGHQFVRMVRDGVVYMEVGSSGGHFRGDSFAQGWFFQHVWATVKGPKVRFTVKELDAPAGKGRMFDAEDWGDNGPKFNVEDPAEMEKVGN